MLTIAMVVYMLNNNLDAINELKKTIEALPRDSSVTIIENCGMTPTTGIEDNFIYGVDIGE